MAITATRHSHPLVDHHPDADTFLDDHTAGLQIGHGDAGTRSLAIHWQCAYGPECEG